MDTVDRRHAPSRSWSLEPDPLEWDGARVPAELVALTPPPGALTDLFGHFADDSPGDEGGARVRERSLVRFMPTLGRR